MKYAFCCLCLLLVSCSSATPEASSTQEIVHQTTGALAPSSILGETPGSSTVSVPIRSGAVQTVSTNSDIIRGTGLAINQHALQQKDAAPNATVTPGGDISLNFVNADIHTVVKTVLGDMLHLNYVIDPTVHGTVTIQSTRPLARPYVLPTLSEALRFSGIAMVKVNGEYHIVPVQEAPQQGEPFFVGQAAYQPGYRLQIVPLKFVTAADMQQVLEPFAPASTILRVDTARNLLILGGTEAELQPILDTINIFDVDQLAGMSFALFPLKSASAKSVAAELNHLLATQSSTIKGLIKIQTIERLNAILAVSQQPAYLDRLATWIHRLDKVAETGERQLYVYYVQNGRATDLASVLINALGAKGGAGGNSGNLLSGMPVQSQTQVTYTPADSSTPNMQPTGPVPATSASTNQTQATATPSPGANPTGGEGIALGDQSSVRITADKVNNALLIYATPQQYAIVRAALQKLDIVPLQVLIDASIAEVTLTKGLQYGVQYFLQTGNHSVTFSNGTSQTIAAPFPGFAYMFSTGASINSILNLLTSISDVQVISSPELMVLNDQSADLQVGNQVPVATSQAIGVTSPGAPLVNTIEYKDTGVILKITPRVNASGLVSLDISQEVSDVATTTTSGIDSPTIEQRKITTSVAVRSGETIALGGLITDNTNHTRNGIPILSDIPYIGSLFGSTSDTKTRTELLVLITPHVVQSFERARAVTEELREKVPLTLPLFQKVQ